MNRLSFAFFAVALLLVAIAFAALATRVGERRLGPVPAAAGTAPGPAQPSGPIVGF